MQPTPEEAENAADEAADCAHGGDDYDELVEYHQRILSLIKHVKD